jgi:hypothetical protein
MQGETNLTTLLSTLKPEINEEEWVFCTIQEPVQLSGSDILASFREKEGVTVIIPKALAEAVGYPYSFVASWITLRVHSSLEAVGLTAAFSTALAAHGISCNVVAGYYHDHIFVSVRDKDKAMAVLQALGNEADTRLSRKQMKR